MVSSALPMASTEISQEDLTKPAMRSNPVSHKTIYEVKSCLRQYFIGLGEGKCSMVQIKKNLS